MRDNIFSCKLKNVAYKIDMNIMDHQQVDFEIETLLNVGGVSDEFRRYRGVELEDHGLPIDRKARHPSGPSEVRASLLERARQLFTKERSLDDECSSDDETTVKPVTRVIKGADIGDMPTEYVVEDLLPYESPVIGTCVDPSIAVGFRYRVRKLGSPNPYYGGRAMILVSIGKGYGKRMTFESFDVLTNENYFWSDSQPEGFGFSISATEAGQSFDMFGTEDNREVGRVLFEEVDGAQHEVSSKVLPDGTMIKKVKVVADAFFRYGADPHGLLSLHSEEALQISGVATIERPPRSRKAVTKSIEIDHPEFGVCLLYPSNE